MTFRYNSSGRHWPTSTVGRRSSSIQPAVLRPTRRSSISTTLRRSTSCRPPGVTISGLPAEPAIWSLAGTGAVSWGSPERDRFLYWLAHRTATTQSVRDYLTMHRLDEQQVTVWLREEGIDPSVLDAPGGNFPEPVVDNGVPKPRQRRQWLAFVAEYLGLTPEQLDDLVGAPRGTWSSGRQLRTEQLRRLFRHVPEARAHYVDCAALGFDLMDGDAPAYPEGYFRDGAFHTGAYLRYLAERAGLDNTRLGRLIEQDATMVGVHHNSAQVHQVTLDKHLDVLPYGPVTRAEILECAGRRGRIEAILPGYRSVRSFPAYVRYWARLNGVSTAETARFFGIDAMTAARYLEGFEPTRIRPTDTVRLWAHYQRVLHRLGDFGAVAVAWGHDPADAVAAISAPTPTPSVPRVTATTHFLWSPASDSDVVSTCPERDRFLSWLVRRTSKTQSIARYAEMHHLSDAQIQSWLDEAEPTAGVEPVGEAPEFPNPGESTTAEAWFAAVQEYLGLSDQQCDDLAGVERGTWRQCLDGRQSWSSDMARAILRRVPEARRRAAEIYGELGDWFDDLFDGGVPAYPEGYRAFSQYADHRRRRAGLDQRQLAERMGRAESRVQGHLSGKLASSEDVEAYLVAMPQRGVTLEVIAECYPDHLSRPTMVAPHPSAVTSPGEYHAYFGRINQIGSAREVSRLLGVSKNWPPPLNKRVTPATVHQMYDERIHEAGVTLAKCYMAWDYDVIVLPNGQYDLNFESYASAGSWLKAHRLSTGLSQRVFCRVHDLPWGVLKHIETDTYEPTMILLRDFRHATLDGSSAPMSAASFEAGIAKFWPQAHYRPASPAERSRFLAMALTKPGSPDDERLRREILDHPETTALIGEAVRRWSWLADEETLTAIFTETVETAITTHFLHASFADHAWKSCQATVIRLIGEGVLGHADPGLRDTVPSVARYVQWCWDRERRVPDDTEVAASTRRSLAMVARARGLIEPGSADDDGPAAPSQGRAPTLASTDGPRRRVVSAPVVITPESPLPDADVEFGGGDESGPSTIAAAPESVEVVTSDEFDSELTPGNPAVVIPQPGVENGSVGDVGAVLRGSLFSGPDNRCDPLLLELVRAETGNTGLGVLDPVGSEGVSAEEHEAAWVAGLQVLGDHNEVADLLAAMAGRMSPEVADGMFVVVVDQLVDELGRPKVEHGVGYHAYRLVYRCDADGSNGRVVKEDPGHGLVSDFVRETAGERTSYGVSLASVFNRHGAWMPWQGTVGERVPAPLTANIGSSGDPGSGAGDRDDSARGALAESFVLDVLRRLAAEAVSVDWAMLDGGLRALEQQQDTALDEDARLAALRLVVDSHLRLEAAAADRSAAERVDMHHTLARVRAAFPAGIGVRIAHYEDGGIRVTIDHRWSLDSTVEEFLAGNSLAWSVDVVEDMEQRLEWEWPRTGGGERYPHCVALSRLDERLAALIASEHADPAVLHADLVRLRDQIRAEPEVLADRRVTRLLDRLRLLEAVAQAMAGQSPEVIGKAQQAAAAVLAAVPLGKQIDWTDESVCFGLEPGILELRLAYDAPEMPQSRLAAVMAELPVMSWSDDGTGDGIRSVLAVDVMTPGDPDPEMNRAASSFLHEADQDAAAFVVHRPEHSVLAGGRSDVPLGGIGLSLSEEELTDEDMVRRLLHLRMPPDWEYRMVDVMAAKVFARARSWGVTQRQGLKSVAADVLRQFLQTDEAYQLWAFAFDENFDAGHSLVNSLLSTADLGMVHDALESLDDDRQRVSLLRMGSGPVAADDEAVVALVAALQQVIAQRPARRADGGQRPEAGAAVGQSTAAERSSEESPWPFDLGPSLDKLDGVRSHDDLVQFARMLVERFPSFCELRQVGQSEKGEPMWLFSVYPEQPDADWALVYNSTHPWERLTVATLTTLMDWWTSADEARNIGLDVLLELDVDSVRVVEELAAELRREPREKRTRYSEFEGATRVQHRPPSGPEPEELKRYPDEARRHKPRQKEWNQKEGFPETLTLFDIMRRRGHRWIFSLHGADRGFPYVLVGDERDGQEMGARVEKAAAEGGFPLTYAASDDPNREELYPGVYPLAAKPFVAILQRARHYRKAILPRSPGRARRYGDDVKFVVIEALMFLDTLDPLLTADEAIAIWGPRAKQLTELYATLDESQSTVFYESAYCLLVSLKEIIRDLRKKVEESPGAAGKAQILFYQFDQSLRTLIEMLHHCRALIKDGTDTPEVRALESTLDELISQWSNFIEEKFRPRPVSYRAAALYQGSIIADTILNDHGDNPASSADETVDPPGSNVRPFLPGAHGGAAASGPRLDDVGVAGSWKVVADGDGRPVLVGDSLAGGLVEIAETDAESAESVGPQPRADDAAPDPNPTIAPRAVGEPLAVDAAQVEDMPPAIVVDGQTVRSSRPADAAEPPRTIEPAHGRPDAMLDQEARFLPEVRRVLDPGSGLNLRLAAGVTESGDQQLAQVLFISGVFVRLEGPGPVLDGEGRRPDPVRTAAIVETAKELRLDSVIDLRERRRVEEYPGEVAALGVPTVNIPMAASNQHTSVTNIPEDKAGATVIELDEILNGDVAQLLKYALNPSAEQPAAETFWQICNVIANSAGNVLINCAGGRHRAQSVVAVVLHAIGVAEEDVLRSCISKPSRLNDQVITTMQGQGILPDYNPGKEFPRITRWRDLRSFLRILDRHYGWAGERGSVGLLRAFARQLGYPPSAADDLIHRLRSRLLQPVGQPAGERMLPAVSGFAGLPRAELVAILDGSTRPSLDEFKDIARASGGGFIVEVLGQAVGEVSVDVRAVGGELRFEVTDSSCAYPDGIALSPDALADGMRWGVSAHAGGKTVSLVIPEVPSPGRWGTAPAVRTVFGQDVVVADGTLTPPANPERTDQWRTWGFDIGLAGSRRWWTPDDDNLDHGPVSEPSSRDVDSPPDPRNARIGDTEIEEHQPPGDGAARRSIPNESHKKRRRTVTVRLPQLGEQAFAAGMTSVENNLAEYRRGGPAALLDELSTQMAELQGVVAAERERGFAAGGDPSWWVLQERRLARLGWELAAHREIGERLGEALAGGAEIGEALRRHVVRLAATTIEALLDRIGGVPADIRCTAAVEHGVPLLRIWFAHRPGGAVGDAALAGLVAPTAATAVMAGTFHQHQIICVTVDLGQRLVIDPEHPAGPAQRRTLGEWMRGWPPETAATVYETIVGLLTAADSAGEMFAAVAPIGNGAGVQLRVDGDVSRSVIETARAAGADIVETDQSVAANFLRSGSTSLEPVVGEDWSAVDDGLAAVEHRHTGPADRLRLPAFGLLLDAYLLLSVGSADRSEAERTEMRGLLAQIHALLPTPVDVGLFIACYEDGSITATFDHRWSEFARRVEAAMLGKPVRWADVAIVQGQDHRLEWEWSPPSTVEPHPHHAAIKDLGERLTAAIENGHTDVAELSAHLARLRAEIRADLAAHAERRAAQPLRQAELADWRAARLEQRLQMFEAVARALLGQPPELVRAAHNAATAIMADIPLGKRIHFSDESVRFGLEPGCVEFALTYDAPEISQARVGGTMGELGADFWTDVGNSDGTRSTLTATLDLERATAPQTDTSGPVEEPRRDEGPVDPGVADQRTSHAQLHHVQDNRRWMAELGTGQAVLTELLREAPTVRRDVFMDCYDDGVTVTIEYEQAEMPEGVAAVLERHGIAHREIPAVGGRRMLMFDLPRDRGRMPDEIDVRIALIRGHIERLAEADMARPADFGNIDSDIVAIQLSPDVQPGSLVHQRALRLSERANTVRAVDRAAANGGWSERGRVTAQRAAASIVAAIPLDRRFARVSAAPLRGPRMYLRFDITGRAVPRERLAAVMEALGAESWEMRRTGRDTYEIEVKLPLPAAVETPAGDEAPVRPPARTDDRWVRRDDVGDAARRAGGLVSDDEPEEHRPPNAGPDGLIWNRFPPGDAADNAAELPQDQGSADAADRPEPVDVVMPGEPGPNQDIAAVAALLSARVPPEWDDDMVVVITAKVFAEASRLGVTGRAGLLGLADDLLQRYMQADLARQHWVTAFDERFDAGHSLINKLLGAADLGMVYDALESLIDLQRFSLLMMGHTPVEADHEAVVAFVPALRQVIAERSARHADAGRRPEADAVEQATTEESPVSDSPRRLSSARRSTSAHQDPNLTGPTLPDFLGADEPEAWAAVTELFRSWFVWSEQNRLWSLLIDIRLLDLELTRPETIDPVPG